ncbi:MAG: hypothetical protein RL487_824 [Actinomycetota bacterium]|jgi:hypothetical protein
MAFNAKSEPETCEIGAVSQSAKAKTAPLTFDRQLFSCSLTTPECPLTTPFPLSSFDPNAVRQNLSLQVTPEIGAFVERMEAKVLAAATRDSARIFGREMTAESVKAAFCSCLKAGGGPTLLRCKINTEASARPCLCWDKEGQQRALPEDIRGWGMVPKVNLQSLWLNAGRIGCIWEVTDLLVERMALKSPWA